MNRRQFARLAGSAVAVAGGWPAARGAEGWTALVERGEALLRAGNAAEALSAFETAAGHVHSADVELGIVRSHMQAGNYRLALSFAAHVAGAHHDEPGTIALYAWLLNAGGQGQIADRLLHAGLDANPDSAALKQAQQALRTPWPRPGAALMEPPLRAAPFEWPPSRSAGSAVVCSATLTADGAQAIAPASALHGAAALWLRNGLGQTVAATVQRSDPRTGLASLRVAAALPTPASFECSTREPFAGSPGSVVGFAADDAGTPAWPLLHTGFFGRTPANGESRRLGLGAPRGSHGGPVFDAAGRLVGMVLSDEDGDPRLIGMAMITQSLGGPVAPVAELPKPRVSIEAVYAAALLVTLQVVVQR